MCVESIDDCLPFDELSFNDTSYSTRIHPNWNGREVYHPFKEYPSRLRKVDCGILSSPTTSKTRHYELITDHVAFNKNILSKSVRVVRHTGHNIKHAAKKHKKVFIVAAAVVVAVAVIIITQGAGTPEAVSGVAAAAATPTSSSSKKHDDKDPPPSTNTPSTLPPEPLVYEPEPPVPWKPTYSFTEMTPPTPSSPPSFMDKALDDTKRTATRETSHIVHETWQLVGKAEQEVARAQDFVSTTFLNTPSTHEQDAKARTQDVHQKIDDALNTDLAHTYEPGYNSPVTPVSGEIPLPFVPLPGRITPLTAIEANAARTGSLASEALKDIALTERSALVTQEGNIANLKPVGKLEGTVNAVSHTESEVLKTAINQDRHVKFVKDYLEKPTKEVQKGIASYEKQIALHKDKISNPTKYYPDWDKLDPRQREALTNSSWPTEIKVYEEQKNLLQSILDERMN